jgi:D-3-phosphoglycerate dehydrogenase
MKLKVLIIDDVHPVLVEGLKSCGFDVIYLPHAQRNDLLHFIPQVDGLVVRTKTQIDREIIEQSIYCQSRCRIG